MFDSKRFLKHFSLQAAAVLATVGAATFAEPVFANEPTTPVTTTAGTTDVLGENVDLSNQMTAVTILEAKQEGLAVYVEHATESLTLAQEGLGQAKTDLETAYSDVTATETDKVVASVLYQYHLGFYEATAELKTSGQIALDEIDAAIAEMEIEITEFETSLDSLDVAVQLDLYRLKRRVIEELLSEEEVAYQGLQDLAAQAKIAFEEAVPSDYTFEDYKALAHAHGRADALANIAKLSYDYTVLDAKIAELEEAIVAGEVDTEEVISPQLSSEQANTLLHLIDRSLLSPRIPLTVPVDELLDKLAVTTSKEEAEALIKAYESLTTIAATQSKLDQIYEVLKTNYDIAKVTYETNKMTVADATDLLVNEVTYRMLSTYTNGVGMAKGNYPYLVQPTVNEATAVVNGSPSGTFAELPKEKQLELMQLIHQILSNSAYQISRPISPSRFDQRIRFEELFADESVTEEEFLMQANRYAESEALFSPVYTYDFTDLNNRIAALAKTEDNNPTAGSTVPGQSSSDQNPSGQTNQPDQTDKTDVVGQSDLSGNTTQTNPVEEGDQTRKTETAKEGNKDNTTNQTDDVKKPVASAPVAQPAGASQAKVLPATGEGRSAFLSALGLLSLVASVGVIAKKRQD